MVFRSRKRGLGLRPVNRIKHVIDKQLGIVLAVVSDNTLIGGVDNPVITGADQVQAGATVNAIYLKVECYATTAAALANVYMSVYKNPGGNITAPVPNTVGTNDNKRYVIHQEMIMLEQKVNGNPRTLFNGVIVIPRGYRRFASGDFLNVTFLAPGVNISLCLQCHYKEFR